MLSDFYGISVNYARNEAGQREKALKLYPWGGGSCAREFVYSNLGELTVHHKDHNDTNNSEDGSNWVLLCLYRQDHEHSKYLEHDRYGSEIKSGQDEHQSATYNPFADTNLVKK